MIHESRVYPRTPRRDNVGRGVAYVDGVLCPQVFESTFDVVRRRFPAFDSCDRRFASVDGVETHFECVGGVLRY